MCGWVRLLFLLVLLALPSCRGDPPLVYFVVRVVDEQTGRGVPLVELKLPNEVKYQTDSAGVAALDEPSFHGSEVFVEVRSHGYEYPHETFLGRGLNLRVQPGINKVIKIHRTMIAERLYRLTGEGTYRDSILAGLPVPVREPLLNGQVLGQDTVSAAVYRDRIFWIWGDTIGAAFWNFSVSAAVSDVPSDGGLDPSVGVNYRYFTDREGRAKAMLPLPGEGLVWIEGMFTVEDPQGRERLLATYTRQQGLVPPDECGMALFNDEKELFESWIKLPCTRGHVSSHPFLHKDGGREYWYLYPSLRVPNDWNAVQDPKQWEKREVELPPIAAGVSCVAWNEYRRRWIMFLENFGDVFYAEADFPEGPWGSAVRIVHHDHYNFYNVAHHPFFNQGDGRVVYFEGTYTDSFTDAKERTPRYNYNQIMYRIRLDDPRLKEAQRP